MIAEDEPNIVTSVEFLMKANGFDTRIARDGEEALGLLPVFRPHLVILDVMLPRRSGLEICRFIRAEPSLVQTRVMMLTAKGSERDLELGMGAGADDYVLKPFSTQELVGRVKALLAGGPEGGP
jgi:two-component system, OmpR family, alkaline phosphatase synthesis response regulator PhoP